jgi:hypothetical protein
MIDLAAIAALGGALFADSGDTSAPKPSRGKVMHALLTGKPFFRAVRHINFAPAWDEQWREVGVISSVDLEDLLDQIVPWFDEPTEYTSSTGLYNEWIDIDRIQPPGAMKPDYSVHILRSRFVDGGLRGEDLDPEHLALAEHWAQQLGIKLSRD